ncbi:MAG TPA: DUF58 domain-containing protein [Micromonosporaceae bacterium]
MRLTTRGLALTGAGAVLTAVGFLLGYPELAALGAAALISVVVAVGYTAWRPGLAVARTAEPDRVGRGEPCHVTLTVRNTGRLRAATLVAYDRCGAVPVPVPLLRLRPGRDSVTRYPVPTSRRGVVDVGPLRVSRRDPLGLATLSRRYGGTTRVWVHPHSHRLAAVPVGITRSLDGRVDRVPHGSITFDRLREYVPGDELRRVHWRTTARVGDLMVREHLDTSLPRIVVLLDDRAVAYPDLSVDTSTAFEAACEAAASLVLAAVRDDIPVTLVLVGDAAGAREDGARVAGEDAGHPTGEPGAGRLLDRLAEADPRAAADTLEPATRRLRQHRTGDTLIFLTGAADPEDLAQVRALQPAYPVTLVTAFDPVAPSAVDGVTVLAVRDAAEFAAAWDGMRAW